MPVDPLDDSNALHCDKTGLKVLAVSYGLGNDGDAFGDGRAVDRRIGEAVVVVGP